MNITYIHHSCFFVETDSCYYLFDYEKGQLPALESTKPICVFASHWHYDHYNPEVFSLLDALGMQTVQAVLSDDIKKIPQNTDVLLVQAGKTYTLPFGQTVTTFQSTDVGVAFLIEDHGKCIYHAGDLNDWVWDEESDADNARMTNAYQKQIHLLSKTVNGREIDVAFVVLDPRQEKDYDRGMCYFLEHIPVKQVYPMHYWGQAGSITSFLAEHPQYETIIQKTEL